MKSTHSPTLPIWLAVILTLAMAIFVRELSVVICQWAGIEKAANIVGLVAITYSLVG